MSKDLSKAAPREPTIPNLDPDEAGATFAAPAPAAPMVPVTHGGGEMRAPATISTDLARPFILIFSGKYHSTPRGPRPTLFPQVLKGGVGGVRAVLNKRTGWVEYHTAGLLDDLAQAGKIGLPLSLAYCVAADPALPNVWRPAWGKVVRDRIVEDPEEYDRWLVRWMDTGVLPRPSAEDLDDLKDRDARILGINVAEAIERFKAAAAATVAA